MTEFETEIQTVSFEQTGPHVIEVHSGPRGPQGPTWHTGPWPIESGLGAADDHYLVASGTTNLGNIYKKSSGGTWTLEGNIRGPQSGIISVNGQTASNIILTAADITSGKFSIAQIPTGTTATTVALGNHNHDSAYQAIIPAGTTAQYFRGDKTWQPLTAAAVGLGSVNNTADSAKPISTATQTALNLKAPIASPTFTGTVSGITKAMVGLSSVDNTSDAAKPISTATQTALNLKAPLASPTFTGTVAGISKAMVGLGSVDDTSDLLKPISNATQAGLDAKMDKVWISPTGTVRVRRDIVQAYIAGQTTQRYFRINTKIPLTSTGMLKFRIKGYNYTGGVIDGWFKAYMYNNAGGTIHGARWVNVGDQTVTVKAHSDADNNLVIVLDATLAYPRISVDELEVAFGSASESFFTGWTITNVADISDLSAPQMTTHRNLWDELAGKQATIAAGTTAQYYRGDRTWQTLNATAVGLGSVNNTTDLAKPISTATQTALNAKSDTTHGHVLTDANITGVLPLAQMPEHTHPYVPTNEIRIAPQLPYRMELNYPIESSNPNLHEVKDSRGQVVTWHNEAGQLRFRNPYSTWADSGVRGVIEPGDYTGTALGGGNFVELVDRNLPDVAGQRKTWGIRWATGKTVRYGVEVPDLFMRQAASDPIPSSTPPGSVVVTLDGERNIGGTVTHKWSSVNDTAPELSGDATIVSDSIIDPGSIKIGNTATAAHARFTLPASSKASIRFYMKTPNAWPANATTILGLRPTASTLSLSVFLTGQALPGRVRLIKTGGITVAESPTILSLNTVYRVEVRYDATRSMASLVVYDVGEDVAKWNSGMRIDSAYAATIFRVDIGRVNAVPAMNDWYLDGIEILDGAFGPVGRHEADILSPTAQPKPPYAGALSYWDGNVLWGIMNH